MHSTQLNNLSKKSSGVNGAAPYWAQFQSLLQRAWVVNNIHFGIDEYNSPLCLERYNDNKHTTILIGKSRQNCSGGPVVNFLIWALFYDRLFEFLVIFDRLSFTNLIYTDFFCKLVGCFFFFFLRYTRLHLFIYRLVREIGQNCNLFLDISNWIFLFSNKNTFEETKTFTSL